MDRNTDTLHMLEFALHAVMDSLVAKTSGVTDISASAAQEVTEECASHIKQLYTLMRYRALAQVGELILFETNTGLPASVEISRVYQDARATDSGSAKLVSEKGELVEYVLSNAKVPEAYVAKAIRTAYQAHAARYDLQQTFFLQQSNDDDPAHDSMYWCAWFHHAANGRIAFYTMRFALRCEPEEVQRALSRLAREVRSGSMTSPGIYGARIDESVDEVHPKEVHAWSITSLVLGGDLHGTGGGWGSDEFLVYATYEMAYSEGEREVSQGFLRGSVTRQVWQTGSDPEMRRRLTRRHKEVVFAPHSVLQRMNREITQQAYVPVVAETTS